LESWEAGDARDAVVKWVHRIRFFFIIVVFGVVDEGAEMELGLLVGVDVGIDGQCAFSTAFFRDASSTNSLKLATLSSAGVSVTDCR